MTIPVIPIQWQSKTKQTNKQNKSQMNPGTIPGSRLLTMPVICASASLTKPDHLASLSIACATIQSAPHLACSIHSLPHSPGTLLPYQATPTLPTPSQLHPFPLLRTPSKLLFQLFPASSLFYSTLHPPRRIPSLSAMPSSLYVPVLVAGMLITVRPLLPSPSASSV